MEQCPIKEMEITFSCVQDTENSLFEPIPAKKIRPEWYKKLPLIIDNHGKPTDTIKNCPAMQDYLNTGYLVRNRHTVVVAIGGNQEPGSPTENEPISVALALRDDTPKEKFNKIKFLVNRFNKIGKEKYFHDIIDYVKTNNVLVEELDNEYVLGGHPAAQTRGSGFDDKMAFKFKMDFIVKTPKGTSTYWLDPFLFNNPFFNVWQGVIDTDEFNGYNTTNSIIFYPKADDSFIIPKGTPLVQLVPFVRYPWKHKIEYFSREEIVEMCKNDEINARLSERQDEANKGVLPKEYKSMYRKNYASKKEFR